MQRTIWDHSWIRFPELQGSGALERPIGADVDLRVLGHKNPMSLSSISLNP